MLMEQDPSKARHKNAFQFKTDNFCLSRGTSVLRNTVTSALVRRTDSSRTLSHVERRRCVGMKEVANLEAAYASLPLKLSDCLWEADTSSIADADGGQ